MNGYLHNINWRRCFYEENFFIVNFTIDENINISHENSLFLFSFQQGFIAYKSGNNIYYEKKVIVNKNILV